MYVVGWFVGLSVNEELNIYNLGNMGLSMLIGNGGSDMFYGHD